MNSQPLSPAACQKEFDRLQQLYGIPLDEGQQALVLRYWRFLQKWNRKIHLTAVNDFREALQFHFFEAFWAAEHFLEGFHQLADVGSGAGFPGLAVKLLRPGFKVALLESSHKKSVFLREAARELELDVEVFHGRAEEFQGWDGVEAALIRALKPSMALLGLMRRHGIPLICFHGRDFNPPPGMYTAACRTLPGSRHRIVSRLNPARA